MRCSSFFRVKRVKISWFLLSEKLWLELRGVSLRFTVDGNMFLPGLSSGPQCR